MSLDKLGTNEQFRELCYIGDLDLVKSFYLQEAPDINSQNKMNGWTVLHWAAKKNHAHVVEYLLSVGADPRVPNIQGKLAAELSTSDAVKKLLKFEVATESVEDLPNQTENKFVPNFIKNPDFHYSNKTYTGLYNDSNSTTKIGNDDNKNKESFTSPTPDPSLKIAVNNTKQILNKPTSIVESDLATSSSDIEIITIKVRAHGDEDFVELDIDKRMTFDQFKTACVNELDHITNGSPVFKIRKLPNVLIRKTADVKRLKQEQEIEFIFGRV